MLQFWRAAIQNWSYGAKLKVLEVLPPSKDSRGESVPCFFHLLEAAHIPLLMTPFHLESEQSHLTFASDLSFPDSDSPAPLFHLHELL